MDRALSPYVFSVCTSALHKTDGRDGGSSCFLCPMSRGELGDAETSVQDMGRVEKVRDKRKGNFREIRDAAHEPLKHAAGKMLTCLLYRAVPYSRHSREGIGDDRSGRRISVASVPLHCRSFHPVNQSTAVLGAGLGKVGKLRGDWS